MVVRWWLVVVVVLNDGCAVVASGGVWQWRCLVVVTGSSDWRWLWLVAMVSNGGCALEVESGSTMADGKGGWWRLCDESWWQCLCGSSDRVVVKDDRSTIGKVRSRAILGKNGIQRKLYLS